MRSQAEIDLRVATPKRCVPGRKLVAARMERWSPSEPLRRTVLTYKRAASALWLPCSAGLEDPAALYGQLFGGPWPGAWLAQPPLQSFVGSWFSK